MNRRCFYFLTISVLLFTAEQGMAEDITGGVIKYHQITKYNFKTTGKSTRWDNFIATLPPSGKKAKVLYFTTEKALYENDAVELETPNKGLQKVLMFMSKGKPPSPVLEKVYYDFAKDEMTRQVTFMTRDFLIVGEKERKAWKLTNKMTKVQGYMCMSAELKMGDDTFNAWFTPEIPISAGPDLFYGLPGLILVVEKNGETAFMATSVDVTPPDKDAVSKPDRGKKVTQKEFAEIMAEKIVEFKETVAKKKGKR